MRRFVIAVIAFVAFTLGAVTPLRADDGLSPASLKPIATWLAANFDLPQTDALPTIRRVPPAAITALRYRGFLGASGQVTNPQASAGHEVVAVYSDKQKTIYLPEGWTGHTLAEVSVLVHEMVHHLQNEAQAKFPCPQAREKVAYAAQQQWLERDGRSLEEEFQLDLMTILVTTSCM